jgi:hypothetical protein
MRNVIPYLLILLIAFHATGLSMVYLVELQRCEMESESSEYPAEESLLIEFTEGEMGFVLVNNHEILHEGKLFDIRKKEIRNGRKVYLAVSDAREDRCMEGIERIANGHSTENSLPGKAPVFKCMKYTCCPGFENIAGFFPLDPLPVTHFSPGFYREPGRDIFAPPPNRFCRFA